MSAPVGERRDRWQVGLMLAPFVVGLLVLVAAPAVATVALSFAQYDLIRPAEWAGLGNYAELLFGH